MWRWNNIHDTLKPDIIKDHNDNDLYTLKVQDKHGRALNRQKAIKKLKYNNDIVAFSSIKESRSRFCTEPTFIDGHFNKNAKDLWEGHFGYQAFKNIIINNIACVKLHTVYKSNYHSPDCVVMFLTGEWNDIFLVCSNDLMKWDKHESRVYP